MSIEHEVMIEAPVDVVWRTVTEPDQIARWFSDEAKIDMREGGDGTLTWTDKETKKSDFVHISVVALQPPRLFSYRWCHPEGSKAVEGNSVLVEFTLSPEGERTRLRVTETGVDDLGMSDEQKAAFVEDHNDGWSQHLPDLATYAAAVSAR